MTEGELPLRALTGFARAGSRRGTVERYSSAEGLGVVRAGSGEAFPFHCTAISDGTREIEQGVAVLFELRLGQRGLLEATSIVEI